MSNSPASQTPLERFRALVGNDPDLVAIATEISETDSQSLAEELSSYWDDDVDPAMFAEPVYEMRGENRDEEPHSSGLNAVLERAGWIFRSSVAFPPLVRLGSDPIIVEFEVEPETQSVCRLGPVLSSTFDTDSGVLVVGPIGFVDGYDLRIQVGTTDRLSLGVDVVSGSSTMFRDLAGLPNRLVISWREHRRPDPD